MPSWEYAAHQSGFFFFLLFAVHNIQSLSVYTYPYPPRLSFFGARGLQFITGQSYRDSHPFILQDVTYLPDLQCFGLWEEARVQAEPTQEHEEHANSKQRGLDPNQAF